MSSNPIVEAKLTSLRRCVARIEEKRPPSLDALESDPDLQDILAVNLERAVQLCVDVALHVIAASDRPVPRTMGESFRILEAMGLLDAKTAEEMVKAVGFRNVAVHLYQQIDWEIVLEIVSHRLNAFRTFARSILEHTDESPRPGDS